MQTSIQVMQATIRKSADMETMQPHPGLMLLNNRNGRRYGGL